MVGREDSKDTHSARADTGHHIPSAAVTHRWVRTTIPDVDMRSERETVSQQFRDMASMVNQLASEVLQLKSNPTPPATAANNDSLSHLTVSFPPAVVAIPLPTPLVVSTGEPVHYDSGPRPKRQYFLKLESYADQSAFCEAFLEKYEEHSRYYK